MNLKNYDHIFLDLDGPVLNGKNKHYECYKDIVKNFGGNPLTIDIYWELKRSIISRSIVLELTNFKGTYENFFDSWVANIESEKYLSFDILKPKVKETLCHWKQNNIKIVLVTMRQNRTQLIKQLKIKGIYELFDKIIDCSPLVKNSKYKKLKGYSFSKAVFIGDTEEDTKTAEMLHIQSIGITTGLRKKELLNASYYFDEIKDINLEDLV